MGALSGFEVVCAGKGTKHLPAYHEVTPATVWEHYGLSARADGAALNAQMFCSFLDGTKSAVEMAAVANATGLVPQARGLGFPPAAPPTWRRSCGRRARAACSTAAPRSRWSRACTPTARRLPATCAGACTSRSRAGDRFVAAAFAAYGLATSGDGRVAALWRPSHLVGLELGVSVARAGARRRADGRGASLRLRASHAAPSATCGPGRRSTARAASMSTASCGACRRPSAHACCRWDWPAERASYVT